MKTPIKILSDQLGLSEDHLTSEGMEQVLYLSVPEALKFAKTLLEQSEQNKMLLMAEHQLTGFNHASQGYGVEDLVSAMNLSKDEWETLRLNIGYVLSDRNIEHIDAYFENKKNT